MTPVNAPWSRAPRLKHEGDRIALLLRRDGKDATVEWVRRTLRIYRRAVLGGERFAGTDTARRGYIESYCDFKRWLAATTQW